MAATIISLPYDILRILALLLDGADVAHMLCTCKLLYAHINDDAIWQEQCARYSVTDRGLFAAASFFEIYSEVLHKYGPLLGLWASDHPYHGSIIEFSLDADAHAIVGTLWRFPSGLTFATVGSWDHPSLPNYHRFVTISIPASTRRVDIRWCLYEHASEQLYDALPTVQPSFHILSPTNESQYASDGVESSRLPDFPDPDDRPWYDHARGLPRLRTEPAPISRGSNMIPRAHRGLLYSAQTEAVKPAALAIYGDVDAPLEVFSAYDSNFRVQDLRSYDLSGTEPRHGPRFHRRFYPLRFPGPLIAGHDPADKDWRPASLEGLWLGAYSAHGTEVLYVYVDETAQEVRAMKVTGDMNVPRGAVSWAIRLEDRMRPCDLPHDPEEAHRAFGDDLEKVKIFRGRGTTSTIGYLEEGRGYSTDYVCIVGPDEISVNWYDMDPDFTPRYKRYKGRDPALEA